MIPYLGECVKTVGGDFVSPVGRIYQEARTVLRKELRRARLSLSLKQGDVCKMMGKGPRFVSKVENGDRHVSFIDLLMFSRIYRKNLSYFSGPIEPIITRHFSSPAKPTQLSSGQ